MNLAKLKSIVQFCGRVISDKDYIPHFEFLPQTNFLETYISGYLIFRNS